MRFLVWLVLLGCAPAMPAWTGASTTPKNRTDLAVGGAARLPVGKLRETDIDSRYRDTVEGAGIVPVAAVRHGLTRHLDLGLMVSGTLTRLELRGEWNTREGSTRSTLMWTVAPYGGPIADSNDSGNGARLGVDIPIAWGADFGGVYDVWVGARLGMEHAWGDFALGAMSAAASATSVRAGGMLGMAGGFRRVHGFIEVTVAYEHWFAEHGSQSLNRGGIVVTPSFGLRLRL